MKDLKVYQEEFDKKNAELQETNQKAQILNTRLVELQGIIKELQ